MKKLISFLLVMVLLVSVTPFAVGATDADEKIEFTYKSIEVDSGNVALEVYMNVKTSVARLWGFDCVIAYSEGLTLDNIVFGNLLSNYMHTSYDSANAINEVALVQDSGLMPSDKAFAGGEHLVATLTFSAEENFDVKDARFAFVPDTGSAVRIKTYENELIVEFISDITPGDTNDDGKVNGKDYAMLLQSINGWDTVIEKTAADVTGDGKINGRDYALLLQYINGWDVTLKFKL